MVMMGRFSEVNDGQIKYSLELINELIEERVMFFNRLCAISSPLLDN
jgi:hypothetical protein